MLISTMTRAFQTTFGYLDGIEKLCKLGFDCLDMTLTHLGKGNDILLSDDFELIVKQIREIAEKHNVKFNQAHAPYRFDYPLDAFFTDEKARNDIIFRTKRSIKIASMLGAKAIVIHPIHNKNYVLYPNEYFLEINKKFYGEFANFAKENNIKIAVENMWQLHHYTKAIIADVCSNPHELANYVDTLNATYGDTFTACLDIGHCALTGVEPEEAIKILGDRLTALHVHDNDYQKDLHLLPFTQKIDFAPIMQSLSEVGYSGELTFEADYYLERFPSEELEKEAKTLFNTGKKLISLIK